MAALELDPLFLKALTLLRSKSRDSADQLKALLDEVLGKKSSNDPPNSSKPTEAGRKKELKEERIKKSISLEDRRGSVKRPLDKQVSVPKPDAIKKLKIEIPKKASTIRKPVIDDDDDRESDDDTVFEAEKVSNVINISSDSDDLTPRGGGKKGPTQGTDMLVETDMDDFALELGLACVVCKKMDVSAKNQLIECQECHSLYHQFCHKPAATDADANDPRLVWYCAKCQRNMRKSVDKKPLKASSSLSDLSSTSVQKTTTGDAAMNLFKRSEPKTPPISSAGKSQPFTGLANFAANVSGKGSASTKSSSISSKPSTIIGKSNIRVNMASGPTKPVPIKPMPVKSGPSKGVNIVPSRPGPARTGPIKPGPTKPASSGPGVSRSMSSSGGPSKPSSSLSSSRTIVSKFKTNTSGSRSPSPQPLMGASKAKSAGTKNLPQTSQASAMKRLQQMKKKASKR